MQTILQKEEEPKFKETDTRTILHMTKRRNSWKKQSSESDTVFFKQFTTAQSINDLLDLAVLPNLSTTNALKLISSITNQINSGKSQVVNIEADERFIHLRKLVKNSGETKTREALLNNLSQYSQLSTPAMVAVSMILVHFRYMYTLFSNVFLYECPCLQCLQLSTPTIIAVGMMFVC